MPWAKEVFLDEEALQTAKENENNARYLFLFGLLNTVQ